MTRAKLQMLKPGMRTLGPALKELNPSSWRSGKTTAERGYGSKWQRERAAFLARPENVCCVMCRAEGIVTAAEIVDHKVPHRGDEGLMWDRSNFQSLCKFHHDSHKQHQERSGNAAGAGVGHWPPSDDGALDPDGGAKP